MAHNLPPVSESDTNPRSRSASRSSRLGQPASLPSSSGRVVEETTGLPLAGVVVDWATLGGVCEATLRTSCIIQLGKARTGEDGAFEIVPTDTSEVRQA